MYNGDSFMGKIFTSLSCIRPKTALVYIPITTIITIYDTSHSSLRHPDTRYTSVLEGNMKLSSFSTAPCNWTNFPYLLGRGGSLQQAKPLALEFDHGLPLHTRDSRVGSVASNLGGNTEEQRSSSKWWQW